MPGLSANDALSAPYKALALAVSSLIQLGRDDSLSSSTPVDAAPLRDATSAIVVAIRQLLEVSARNLLRLLCRIVLIVCISVGAKVAAFRPRFRVFRVDSPPKITFAALVARRSRRVVSLRFERWQRSTNINLCVGLACAWWRGFCSFCCFGHAACCAAVVGQSGVGTSASDDQYITANICRCEIAARVAQRTIETAVSPDHESSLADARRRNFDGHNKQRFDISSSSSSSNWSSWSSSWSSSSATTGER